MCRHNDHRVRAAWSARAVLHTRRFGYTNRMSAHHRTGVRPEAQRERGAPEAAPRNYMTPQGYARLRSELKHLLDVERPEVVGIVAWAASNGDRSENGDYIYGKKRLREIDRRIRYLTRRVGSAMVVDPAARGDTEQIYFGATVTYGMRGGDERTISIVGIDEADSARGRVSWISPIAKALLRKHPGDVLRVATPGGIEDIEVLDVRYEPLD
jgi:transcription elongation factor GreB